LNVLSLFDGISCGRVALERAGIPVDNYYSSEIDKFAIKVANHNWPGDTGNRLGDITAWKTWNIDWGDIDLILTGSPCQSISNLGDRTGLDGKSGLFFSFLNILNCVKEHNPDVKFVLENVKGGRKAINTISDLVGVEPVEINSNLFSAQNRQRLYWTNINIPELPTGEHKDSLRGVLEDSPSVDVTLTPGRKRWLLSDSGKNSVNKGYTNIDKHKAACLTARSEASWNCNYVTRNGELTKLSPIEYERLQTLPDRYTEVVSNSQRYKSIGNGWTVDVIAHILRGLND